MLNGVIILNNLFYFITLLIVMFKTAKLIDLKIT